MSGQFIAPTYQHVACKQPHGIGQQQFASPLALFRRQRSSVNMFADHSDYLVLQKRWRCGHHTLLNPVL